MGHAQRLYLLQGGRSNSTNCPVGFVDPDVVVVTNDTINDRLRQEIVNIAANAYYHSDNQVLRYLSCERGLEALRIYMAILLELSLLHGWVVCRRIHGSEKIGTTCWFIRPGQKIGIWEQIKQLPAAMQVTGFGWNFLRLLWDLWQLDGSHQRAMQVMRQRWGDDDHVYALNFASYPEGRGGLNAILRPVLDWCQIAQVPCYLEAADEGNVRRYWHFDFQMLWNIALWTNWWARLNHQDEPLRYPAMIWWPEPEHDET